MYRFFVRAYAYSYSTNHYLHVNGTCSHCTNHYLHVNGTNCGMGVYIVYKSPLCKTLALKGCWWGGGGGAFTPAWACTSNLRYM